MPARLTDREREIYYLLMQGEALKRIAFELFMARRTVAYHCESIYRKMGVNSRLELLVRENRRLKHKMREVKHENIP